MTHEPVHSAQEQSLRIKEKISFGFVGHQCRNYVILISEVKSLRFEL